jgi:hypothetical protein
MANQLSSDAAKWGLIALGTVGSITLIVAAMVATKAIAKHSDASAKLLNNALQDGIVVRMGTIFGIVLTTGILALAGALTDGAVAVLSGIAGYVLGGISRKAKSDVE